jgi:tRNA-binding EMAP/Myf-like protein
MIISLQWLLEHLELSDELSEQQKLKTILEQLNTLGMEAESFVTHLELGKIVSVELLPKTQLFRCIVQKADDTTICILTKMTTVQENKYAWFTPAEYIAPNGVEIARRSMFGAISEGMFNCILEERPQNSNIAVGYQMLKIACATNRPDLQSVRGIARELSCAIGKLKPLMYNNFNNYSTHVMQLHGIDSMSEFIKQDIGYSDISYGLNEINGYLTSLSVAPVTEVAVKPTNACIYLSHAQFYKISGLSLSLQLIEEILSKSGFFTNITRRKNDINVYDDFGIEVIAPHWRTDIENDMSIIEEVIKKHGLEYENKVYPVKEHTLGIIGLEEELKTILCANGYTEMYSIPFVNNAINATSVSIINPMSKTTSVMRTTLLDSLLKSATHLLNHNEIGAQLYEIGKVYPSEEKRLGILLVGELPANILNVRTTMTDKHLHTIISLLNLDIYGCTTCTVTNTGCTCNFILTGKLKAGKTEYIYYYCESKLHVRTTSNHFTNSMDKLYTNINVDSNTETNWPVLMQCLRNIEYRVVGYGYFRDKYRLTITISYKTSEQLDMIKDNISTKLLATVN